MQRPFGEILGPARPLRSGLGDHASNRVQQGAASASREMKEGKKMKVEAASDSRTKSMTDSYDLGDLSPESGKI